MKSQKLLIKAQLIADGSATLLDCCQDDIYRTDPELAREMLRCMADADAMIDQAISMYIIGEIPRRVQS